MEMSYILKRIECYINDLSIKERLEINVKISTMEKNNIYEFCMFLVFDEAEIFYLNNEETLKIFFTKNFISLLKISLNNKCVSFL